MKRGLTKVNHSHPLLALPPVSALFCRLREADLRGRLLVIPLLPGAAGRAAVPGAGQAGMEQHRVPGGVPAGSGLQHPPIHPKTSPGRCYCTTSIHPWHPQQLAGDGGSPAGWPRAQTSIPCVLGHARPHNLDTVLSPPPAFRPLSEWQEGGRAGSSRPAPRIHLPEHGEAAQPPRNTSTASLRLSSGAAQGPPGAPTHPCVLIQPLPPVWPQPHVPLHHLSITRHFEQGNLSQPCRAGSTLPPRALPGPQRFHPGQRVLKPLEMQELGVKGLYPRQLARPGLHPEARGC